MLFRLKNYLLQILGQDREEQRHVKLVLASTLFSVWCAGLATLPLVSIFTWKCRAQKLPGRKLRGCEISSNLPRAPFSVYSFFLTVCKSCSSSTEVPSYPFEESVENHVTEDKWTLALCIHTLENTKIFLCCCWKKETKGGQAQLWVAHWGCAASCRAPEKLGGSSLGWCDYSSRAVLLNCKRQWNFWEFKCLLRLAWERKGEGCDAFMVPGTGAAPAKILSLYLWKTFTALWLTVVSEVSKGLCFSRGIWCPHCTLVRMVWWGPCWQRFTAVLSCSLISQQSASDKDQLREWTRKKLLVGLFSVQRNFLL